MQRFILVTTLATAALAGCASDGDGDDDNPACGDGTCDPDETAASCGADCAAAACGDGTCDPGETASSCPADCPATCGNGTCEPAEDAAACPADCDPTACTTAPDTCTGEDLCLDGRCVSAFGRNYIIRVDRGVLPEHNASGGAWDIAGGLPDPKVDLTVNGTLISTPVIGDTLMPQWMFDTPPTLIPGGTVFRIGVLDSDIDADDLAWACVADPLTADFLRAGGLRCSGTGELAAGHVDILFTPN
jgi:hypothetical protein